LDGGDFRLETGDLALRTELTLVNFPFSFKPLVHLPPIVKFDWGKGGMGVKPNHIIDLTGFTQTSDG